MLEMKRRNIYILGDFWSADFRVIFVGVDKKIAGVGIIMNKDMRKRVNTDIQYNNRIISI
ncbi:craniofacial development protein 2-like [Aphis craccivora]|uniref:Craniofacial development protein 2-like n=1 Tax=Aphis craccivora TaxID=307492 RepID=A0A6G0XZQ5_APHCR|nr:craniofacial development protein 2-like [Aphis craccivora]